MVGWLAGWLVEAKEQQDGAIPSSLRSALASEIGVVSAKCKPDVGQSAQKARLTDVSDEHLMLLCPMVGVMDAPWKTLMDATSRTNIATMDACGFMATERGAQLVAKASKDPRSTESYLDC